MVKLKISCMLKVLSGILLISALTVPVIFTGSAEAANRDGVSPRGERHFFAVPQRWPDKNELVAQISKQYGVSFTSLLNYCNQGGRLEDACRIAHMAMLSNKSFDSIVSMKSEDKSWTDVFREIGISEKIVREFRKSVAADMLKLKYGIEREIACSLIDQRYKLGDIAKAGQLAVLAKMDVREVLAMKRINNSWADVEEQLKDKLTT